jgi:signal transduction histidine kinase
MKLLIAVLLASASLAFAQETPPDSPKAKEVQTLVNKAADLINSRGTGAFTELRSDEFRKGDFYVFVSDMNGINLFNGGFPEREGTDNNTLKDANGKMIVKEQIALIDKKGQGWMSYMWPKPGEQQPMQKWSYIKSVLVAGKPSYVGAGFYPE